MFPGARYRENSSSPPFRAPGNEATYNSWLYIERFTYSSGLTVDLVLGWPDAPDGMGLAMVKTFPLVSLPIQEVEYDRPSQ